MRRSVELKELQMKYLPQKAIKAQAIANFIIEFIVTDKPSQPYIKHDTLIGAKST